MRHIAWIIKLKTNWVNKKRCINRTTDFSYLLPKDLELSIKTICKLAQVESFPDEYCSLKTTQTGSSKSNILSLKPELDENIIRIGGRIRHAELPFDFKHPIILSGKHMISKLILLDLHLKNLHSGREYILSLSRDKFWITKGKKLGKSIIQNCFICKRQNVKPKAPIMSDLPKERLSFNEKPFTHTGIDYFGPINVKLTRKTRSNQATHKRYGALFTCLTTRAVHLELASDLSTDIFILAFGGSTAHRGKPKEILSDNGTNFIGADRDLGQAIQDLNQSKIQTLTSSCGIVWKFNPPVSPWMGGSWESLIKLSERTLKTVTNDKA